MGRRTRTVAEPLYSIRTKDKIQCSFPSYAVASNWLARYGKKHYIEFDNIAVKLFNKLGGIMAFNIKKLVREYQKLNYRIYKGTHYAGTTVVYRTSPTDKNKFIFQVIDNTGVQITRMFISLTTKPSKEELRMTTSKNSVVNKLKAKKAVAKKKVKAGKATGAKGKKTTAKKKTTKKVSTGGSRAYPALNMDKKIQCDKAFDKEGTHRAEVLALLKKKGKPNASDFLDHAAEKLEQTRSWVSGCVRKAMHLGYIKYTK